MASVREESAVWGRAVRQVLGGSLPSNLVIFDTETDGLDPSDCNILQCGLVIVRDGAVVHEARTFLNPCRCGITQEADLRARMSKVAAGMAARNKPYRLDADVVLTEGDDPSVFFAAILALLETSLANGLALVGHNIVNFDLPLLCHTITRVTGQKLLIPPHLVWDTGMMEKARCLNNTPNMGEGQLDWFRRVGGIRSKVKWALDGAASEHHNLWARSGLDVTAAHDALSDCRLTHCLFQSLREIIENA